MVGKKITVFDVFNVIFFAIFGLLCLYPMYYLVIYSLSNSSAIASNPTWLIPRGFTLRNYAYLFRKPEIINAVFISASRTVLGTLITVFCSSFFAYLLNKKKLIFRKFIYRMLVLTMYLNAGVVPYVILMRTYHLNNSFLLYIIPSAVNAFYVIIIKTYMEGIPDALEEAALLDGAGHFRTYCSVIFPVCLPVIATVVIFSAVGQWNTWQDNFYLVRDRNLKTLQLQLLEYLQTMDQSIVRDVNQAVEKLNRTSSLSLKACISVMSMLPIMVVYPFFQKYFVKGILIGSVKG